MSTPSDNYELALRELAKSELVASYVGLMKLPHEELETFYRMLNIEEVWPKGLTFSENLLEVMELAPELIRRANEEAAFFDGLAYRLYLEAVEEKILAPQLVEWLALVAMGHVQRPKPRGREKKISNKWMNELLAGILGVCCKSLSPTRSSASDPYSGCDAVVEALSREGVHISYAFMEKAWINSKLIRLSSEKST